MVEDSLLDRVVFSKDYEFIASFPQGAGSAWLESPQFKNAFQGWQSQIGQYHEVFLGYSVPDWPKTSGST